MPQVETHGTTSPRAGLLWLPGGVKGSTAWKQPSSSLACVKQTPFVIVRESKQECAQGWRRIHQRRAGGAAGGWALILQTGIPRGQGRDVWGLRGYTVVAGPELGAWGTLRRTGGCRCPGFWLRVPGPCCCLPPPSLRGAPGPIPVNPFPRSNDKSGS